MEKGKRSDLNKNFQSTARPISQYTPLPSLRLFSLLIGTARHYRRFYRAYTSIERVVMRCGRIFVLRNFSRHFPPAPVFEMIVSHEGVA